MAKKSSKSRRRVSNRRQNKSVFGWIMSLPKALGLGVMLLVLFGAYQYNSLSQAVKGVTDVERSVINQMEREGISKETAASSTNKYRYYLGIWKDDNGNGKYGSSETCIPNKDFKINIISGGNSSTKTVGGMTNDCEYSYIASSQKCLTLELVKSSLRTYTLTGAEYAKGSYNNWKSFPGKNRITVCANIYYYNTAYGMAGWLLKPKN
ncbi:MAG: hypothetical protein UT87_C0014G0030 [Candidatus Levybacteria bacterium GW2011_GWC1_40_19]|nr:MAG: hypothetical protein UT87_C0014G0030 [Candidatus Levybacteria bacterium GW2011_GWC1_40_19]OGH21205.1 MAG: hypothetical protein A2695_03120 [Candidatus Levybacteria bacterium RIFCSPHIGHO2_01_FULL_40_83]OGH27037.1 MAG: hypothetical protein A3D82_02285 [Candidatus Levybacteria bacterium RIFCSPHIGHO2_02_FULL_40_29]OGH32818.1 MAG: hypothetical protein A3E70_02370 [Candidatus Levybacteria bacterium RIFCSPHIGHO2_12_FULL_40_44]OGH42146.1 MAG: hypothetical protein A2965_00920 [Candidatus Levybac